MTIYASINLFYEAFSTYTPILQRQSLTGTAVYWVQKEIRRI